MVTGICPSQDHNKVLYKTKLSQAAGCSAVHRSHTMLPVVP